MTRLCVAILLVFLAACSPSKVAVKEANDEPAAVSKGHARKAVQQRASVDTKEEDSPPAGGPYIDLDWGTLRGLDVRSGQTTPLIDLAVGAPVRVAGYLVPFDE
jgi:hypothetical protein